LLWSVRQLSHLNPDLLEVTSYLAFIFIVNLTSTIDGVV